ncbi:hypothetical protein [Bacilliculturomica massiliensis]|uniref:hypothetical protein n=1 Tax=Bacilliculturomica massiliensis TaxID=1917867 RepID=UPI00102FAA1F|nr:hypothetical protein [Bacilliculturomica massiliensis]
MAMVSDGKGSAAELETLVRRGLRNYQIEEHFGLRHGTLAYRIRAIREEFRRRAAQERLREGMTTYYLTPQEVERRYGRPGECPETKEEIDYYIIRRMEAGDHRPYDT